MQTLIQKIEIVQRRAARYVKNRHRNTSSVSDMLCTINKTEKRDAWLCLLYKADRKLVAITKDKRPIQPKRRTRHSHARAYQALSCRTDRRKNSIFTRTVRDWNALLPYIKEIESLVQSPGDKADVLYSASIRFKNIDVLIYLRQTILSNTYVGYMISSSFWMSCIFLYVP